jgi:hypothetical protein
MLSVERIWEEAVVAKFRVLSRYLPGGIKENHEKTTVRIAGVWAEI